MELHCSLAVIHLWLLWGSGNKLKSELFATANVHHLHSRWSRPICSKSDVPTNRRNIHHCWWQHCCGVFRDSGAWYKNADLLTYLFYHTRVRTYRLLLLTSNWMNRPWITLNTRSLTNSLLAINTRQAFSIPIHSHSHAAIPIFIPITKLHNHSDSQGIPMWKMGNSIPNADI